MSKKFGKILLFTAAVGTAAAAAYYFLHKKDVASQNPDQEDEDPDSFGEDFDDAERTYVPLTPEADAEEPVSEETAVEEPVFEEAADLAAETGETVVEEFFDEEKPEA